MTRHLDESVDEHDDKACAEEDVGPSAAESRDDGLARPTEDESCADESVSEVPISPNE